MSTSDHPKVQAILPLTFMQNALLFHSLSTEDDQGFIHVKLDLLGNLDIERLKNSWQTLVNRHDVFRSSIHWEKIKTPVQVVHREADHQWKLVDLSNETEETQGQKIADFQKEDKGRGFDFNKASVSRVSIFRLSDEDHLMIWSCHHLLLDGWSSANVIRELAMLYNEKDTTNPISLPPVPSIKDFKRDSRENDIESARMFWQQYLEGFESPSLVSKYENSNASSQGFVSKKFSFHADEFVKLEAYAKANKLTLTSVLQMAWSIVLSGMQDSDDVIFGNIVSVRSPRLKNADLMCGLFTNMLPVRAQIDPDETLSTLGHRIQKNQGSTKDFSYSSLDNLQKWIDWPGYLPLFDHIFVVENFPWKDIETEELTFSNFRSGITSSYPLTVVVKIDGSLKLDLIYDQAKISEQLVEFFGENLIKVLETVNNGSDLSIGYIHKDLPQLKFETLKTASEASLGRSQNPQIDQPSNPMELKLTGIWENLFMQDGIGIHDNFFEIGGKSLLAVQLFQRIQKELNVNAPPIMILQYPTIAMLASFISGDKEDLKWKSLVPLRVKGNRNPIFCLHAKGGYVFFYNQLASYLDQDQPIYAVQPRGLNGEDPMYESIEEMASHYIQEIKTIQPKGPYNILATCFSNAVGLEMAQQLRSRGDEIGNLYMVDAAPGRSLQDTLQARGALAVANYKIKQTAIYNTGKEIYKKLTRTNNTDESEESFSKKHEKHLEKIFGAYQRQPYDGRITLIRSTEFEKLKRKDFHVEDWLKIVSEENLETLVVEGHHNTLFIEPEVQNLALAFNQHLTQTQDVSNNK